MLYFGFYTSSSSLIAESEETLVFYLDVCMEYLWIVIWKGGEGCEFLCYYC